MNYRQLMAKKFILFTNRCHFALFQNFGKRISQMKANTLLIKTMLLNLETSDAIKSENTRRFLPYRHFISYNPMSMQNEISS